jgi:hypothetical protein
MLVWTEVGLAFRDSDAVFRRHKLREMKYGRATHKPIDAAP